MNADVFAEWLLRQGQRVARTTSTYWHSDAWGVYQAFPYHALIEPSEAELDEMFFRHRAAALRYALPPECSQGCPSYAIVCEASDYDMQRLGYRTRKNVRRGLRACQIEQISFRRLVEQAWELRLDALERQGRRIKITHSLWRKRYMSTAGLEGFEAWAALVEGRIAGYVVTCRWDDCIYFLDQQSHRDYLHLNVNNALTYTVSRNAAARPGVKLLFYGLASLDAPARVAEFKFHMGYAAKPIRQRVVFHPYLAVLANRFSYAAVKKLSEWMPADRRLSKATGMLRLWLEEKSPCCRALRCGALGGEVESSSSSLS
jgi:GNAT acetyltransferase-like protein